MQFFEQFMIFIIAFQCTSCHKIWHSNYLDISRRIRDDFTLKNVSVDENFSLNFMVNFWISKTVRDASYAVGFSENKIVMLKATKNRASDKLSIESRTKAVNETYVDAVLHEIRFQNNGENRNKLFLVAIADGGKLHWFSTENMELFWTWNVGSEAKHIKICFNHVLKRHQLFIASEGEINVYIFEALNRKIWLVETLMLSNPVGSFDVASHRDSFYLLVPQKTTGELIIFKYLDGHFQVYKKLDAAEIQQVVVFKENFKTFFCIDGLDAGIYQFGKRDKILKERILNSQLEGINYWLPVRVNNLKQNLILFAQRILEHGSHKSFVTETFTYNDEHFEEHEDIPCHVFGEKFNSLDCLSNHETSVGIVGAAPLSVGDSLSLLLAKKKAHNLFNMNFEIAIPENPVEKEIRILNDTKNRLQTKHNEKISKYTELALEIKKLWKMEKIVIVPLIISTTGVIPKALHKSLRMLGLEGKLYVLLQKTTILKTCRIDLLDKSFDSIDSMPSELISENPIPATHMRASSFRKNESPLANLNKEANVKARNNIDMSEKLEEMLDTLQLMKNKMDKIEQMEKSLRFKKLIINGSSKIEHVSVKNIHTRLIDGEETESVLEDIVRKDKNKSVDGTKTFSDLDVDNLFFESVNGIKASDLLFQGSETMNFKGNITFENPAAVLRNTNTDWINNMPTSAIVYIKKQIFDTLFFQNINVENLQTGELNKLPITQTWFQSEIVNGLSNLSEDDTIFIPHNVTVKRVNGDDFDDLLQKLCFVNIPTHMPGKITIHGDVIVDERSEIGYLNSIKFPENYFFVDGVGGVSITGKKSFENTLRADEVRTNGQYINEIKTSDIFTLSTKQDILGKATFTNLEVTEKFEHSGKTIGDQINKFLPNPTMLETKIIKSNVNFEDLEVTGSITVVDDLNNFSFAEVLGDIVYKDEENPSINSIKEFPEGLTVRNNLNITSNSINLVPLDQIVTTDTHQLLNIAQLNGNVSIETMKIAELLNGINITKLDQESVKIVGEQFISSVLIFKQDLEVNHLEIEEKLNDIHVENFRLTTGDRIMEHDVTFDEIDAKNIEVYKNFEGKIQGIDLKNFAENRLTYSTNQTVTGDFTVENAKSISIECDEVKTTSCKKIFDKEHVMNSILDRIASGDVTVKELIVNEDLDIERLEGNSLNEIETLKEKSIELNGDVHFSFIEITKLSEVSFRRFLDNVIFKNETDIAVSGSKFFKNGFIVNKLIETEKLNSVNVENLLTKEGRQTVVAPIEIFGNVTFMSNVNILGTMNDISMEDVKNYFEMDDEIYVIKGDIMFDRLSHVYNLEAMDYLNGKEVKDVLDHISYSFANQSFSEETVFVEKVTIHGDLDIKENLNDINLSDENDNIVYLNKPEDNAVESIVNFTGPDTFVHSLIVETDLETKWMFGIDIDTWKEDAVYVNRGLLQGEYHFENVTIHDKLLTEYLNSINLNRTINLGSDQAIDHLTFKNLMFLNNVSVGNLVNGYKLKEEYERSVLSNKEQEILSDICFYNNTLIRNNLEIVGLLNNYPTNKIVTADTNQNLSAFFNFPSKVNLDSNMYVSGFINGINMSVWENGAIKMVTKEPQDIEAPWHIEGNLTFEEPLSGDNVIYGFDIEEKQKLIEEQRRTKIVMGSQYEKDHQTICNDLRLLTEKLNKQIYKFESFEEHQSLNVLMTIRKAFFFTDEKPMLLLNGIGSCKSILFVFENDQFKKVSEIELGEVDQIIALSDDGFTYLVAKVVANPNCAIEGTNVWKYQNYTVENLQSIESQQQLQESRVPSTFYGLNKKGVTEFRIDMNKAIVVYPYRKWKLREENMAFVPRGLGTGLAIRTGQKLVKLLRDDPIVDNEVGFGDVFLRGEMKSFDNYILPGWNNSKLEVMEVGPESIKRTLLAVVFHEDTVVATNLDVIKIYEGYASNRVFQNIPTHNPSKLLSIEFGNGETFLLVLEEGKLLIHQYKGIEGFIRRMSAEVSGSDMFKMMLPLGSNSELIQAIAIVDSDKINIIKPVMVGKRSIKEIEC